MRGYGKRAKQLRALAHPVRLQLLDLLRERASCVCDLVALTGRRQPYISQQLAVLKRAGLVRGDREGLLVRYQLAGPDVVRLIEELGPLLGVQEMVAMPFAARAEVREEGGLLVGWPEVEEELCTGCRASFEHCPKGVYEWDEAGSLPVVTRPMECVPGCEQCVLYCSAGAISLQQQDAPAAAVDGQEVEIDA